MTKVDSIFPKIYQNHFINTSVNSPNITKPVNTTLPPVNDTCDLACDNFINTQFCWLTNPTLKSALKELYNINFDIKDMDYLTSKGLKLPFRSGQEVVNYIASQNIRIVFDKIPEPDIHAHYDYEKNTICINDRYKNSDSKPITLAIASAILHEASHAKDMDGTASVQEELECLAMNALAHRAFVKKYSEEIFKQTGVPIISDGVSLYADLFFNRPDLTDLLTRVKTKYGDLPAGCDKHPASSLAFLVKSL